MLSLGGALVVYIGFVTLAVLPWVAPVELVADTALIAGFLLFLYDRRPGLFPKRA